MQKDQACTGCRALRSYRRTSSCVVDKLVFLWVSAGDVSADQAAQGFSNGADVDVSDEQLNRILQELDKRVGTIIEALPVNGLLVIFTCQGNTAEYRRLQVRLLQLVCITHCA